MKKHFWKKWFYREEDEKPACGCHLLLPVNVHTRTSTGKEYNEVL
jgi:hypothetical protein